MEMQQKNEVVKRLLARSESNMNHFLDFFADQAINNEASLFLGSGVSSESGYLSWGALFKPLAEELEIELDKNSDLYSVAQYYANKHSDATLRKKISSKINQIKKGNELLHELLDIDFNSIWTTNYDHLVERELSNRFVPYNAVYNEKSLASIDRHDKVNIYKLNGDITDPVNMIVTKDDYEHYLDNHALFLTFLKRELVSNTFLFVGYSFSDALVLDCLISINKLLGTSSNTHYAIMVVGKDTQPEFEYFLDDLEKRYNIKCICTLKEDVILILRQLNKRIKENKVFISGSFDTVPDDIVKQADELSYALTVSLLEKDYRISTGIGKRFGTFITGYAHQYLAEHEVQNKSKYLSMRPFPFHLDLSDDTKIKYRTIMQRDCSTAIFLFGQSKAAVSEGYFEKTGHYSTGVYQEFQIACQREMTIIPVGSTGYEAEVIWKEINKEINKYYYLSGRMDALLNERDPNKLSRIILSILDNVSQYSRIN
jgi:hypothetical protein